MGSLIAWRQYHENSLTDHYEIATVTIGSNGHFNDMISPLIIIIHPCIMLLIILNMSVEKYDLSLNTERDYSLRPSDAYMRR